MYSKPNQPLAWCKPPHWCHPAGHPNDESHRMLPVLGFPPDAKPIPQHRVPQHQHPLTLPLLPVHDKHQNSYCSHRTSYCYLWFMWTMNTENSEIHIHGRLCRYWHNGSHSVSHDNVTCKVCEQALKFSLAITNFPTVTCDMWIMNTEILIQVIDRQQFSLSKCFLWIAVYLINYSLHLTNIWLVTNNKK